MSNLLSVEEVQKRILGAFQPLPMELVPLRQACGRVLGEDLVAGFALPPFDNSSVDGFALKASDRTSEPNQEVILKVIGDIPAGVLPQFELQSGQAARIMTGAPLPPGADCVVPVEETDFPYRDPNAGLPETVRVVRFPSVGDNIRSHGQDVQAGAVLLKSGHILHPQDTGMVSTLGHATVLVHRKPRIGLFSSGDELLAPGEPLQPGKIYDANSYTLSDLAMREGAQMIYLGVASDQEEQIREKFIQAVQAGVDLILTSAGVSVGAFDYVRRILEENGALELWRVNMRPGKPLAFGSFQNTPVISLPGNPVSAFIGFLVFIRPVLKKLSGILHWQPREVLAVTEETIHSDGRESYLRAVLTANPSGFTARLTGHQGSGNLFSLVLANALLIVPAGVKSIPAGTVVKTWMLDTTC